MKKFQKQPSEVLDYDIDFSKWFKKKAIDDDIQTVSLSVTSATEANPTLELGPIPHPESVLMGEPPHRIKIWLGGGTEGVSYVVTGIVSTEQDRVKEFEFTVKVKNT